MFYFTNDIYERLSLELLERVNQNDYYSGLIELECENADIRFVASLFIYRKIEQFPEGDFIKISNLIPVWWEMHTTTLDGEVLNDFDFTLLKEHICRE